jgi:hypothetical protein
VYQHNITKLVNGSFPRGHNFPLLVVIHLNFPLWRNTWKEWNVFCSANQIYRQYDIYKPLYKLLVKLCDFTVWLHTWQKDWVNCAVLTDNSEGLGTVFSSRLSHRKNCAVHSGNPKVSSVYLPTPRWHHFKAFKRIGKKTDKPNRKPVQCHRNFSSDFRAVLHTFKLLSLT